MKAYNRLLLFGGRLAIACLVALALSLLYLRAGAQEPNLPLVKPEAETGLALFGERCAGCHGPTGDGDGELAVNLPTPPAAFSDPQFRHTAEPAVMFTTIFNGRFDAGMPPFGPGTENSDPIDEAGIWDLIAAVYSLSTPAEVLDRGKVVYEENCVACHGEGGAGDGPVAAAWENASLDLTNLPYWFNRSNEVVLADVAPGGITAHEYSLSEEALWAAVDYARTFAYGYIDPSVPLAPIESAMIYGQVRNGTVDEIVTGGEVRLRAFTTSFEETLNLTTTVGVDGNYRFDLEMVAPEWVYLSSVQYGELSFSSDAGQLSRAQTELELPITIFDETTDASAVNIDQMHIILDFFEGGVSVNELYVFSNRQAAVFVGESGSVDQGTVRVALPDGAENFAFERALGSFQGSIPATEIIETENGWADTLPLRPGQGTLNLIVRYQMPYEDGLSLSHSVAYDISNVTVILPEAGVTLEENGEWVFQGRQEMPGGSPFLTYNRAGLQAGSNLELSLDGRVRLGANESASALAGRSQSTELLIGGGVLLIALAAGLYVVRSWQAPPHERTADAESYAGGEDEEDGSEIRALLQAIADLDDSYEEGGIEEAAYTAQRARLKDELRSLWA